MFKKSKPSNDLSKSIELIDRKNFYRDVSEISKTLKNIEKALSAKKLSDILGSYWKDDTDKPLPKEKIEK